MIQISHNATHQPCFRSAKHHDSQYVCCPTYCISHTLLPFPPFPSFYTTLHVSHISLLHFRIFSVTLVTFVLLFSLNFPLMFSLSLCIALCILFLLSFSPCVTFFSLYMPSLGLSYFYFSLIFSYSLFLSQFMCTFSLYVQACFPDV